MSRLAKKPIAIPSSVVVVRDNATWTFRGPKGEIQNTFHPAVRIVQDKGSLSLGAQTGRASRLKNISALLGTTAALIKNAVEGVASGFEKKLELEGIGYKAQLDGKDLVFSLGFSHPVRYTAPRGISFATEKNTITVSGVDRALVGQVAAQVRALKPPEPYKGKGIHYVGEVIRRKAGKRAVSAA